MLQNISEFYGHKLAALDGEIGQVKDFYFDDLKWVIRYLVVDAGSWATGRLVLLSPHALGAWDPSEKVLQVKLLKKRIQNSPSIESHLPVSRQYEIEYYKYYGWSTYWDGGELWGLGGVPVMLPPSKEEMGTFLEQNRDDDKHLQSTQAVRGYAVQATDGVIGEVTGFLVEDSNWVIREMVVETGSWFSGKEILIAPAEIKRISYEESKVFVDVSKNTELIRENDFVKKAVGSHG